MARLGHHPDVSPGGRVRKRKCGLDNQLKYDGDAHAAGISPKSDVVSRCKRRAFARIGRKSSSVIRRHNLFAINRSSTRADHVRQF